MSILGQFFCSFTCTNVEIIVTKGLIITIITRKLSYRKDDREMHPIYRCSENFPES